MDNAMVKRGIGAVVLAVIAALLLGYLLKDKSREREAVVMKLPNAPEMNIPSLTGSLTGSDDTNTNEPTLLDNTKANIINATNGVTDKLTNTGSLFVESTNKTIENTTESITTSMDATSTAIQSNKPGFAIRPSLQNEEKEIVDTTKLSPPDKPVIEKNINDIKETVVASTKPVKEAFKPQIVEKKPAKKVVTKKAKTPSKPKPTSNSTISTSPAGKYSIQLLATSSQSRANKLANTMKSEGYVVFVTQATREDKILYRVRVGGHGDRAVAIEAQESMKRRYQKNFFVQNSLVISN